MAHIPGETITVHSDLLDNKILRKLSNARGSGKTAGFPELDSLADGGAQLILSVGKDKAIEVLGSDKLAFELPRNEFKQFIKILNTE